MLTTRSSDTSWTETCSRSVLFGLVCSAHALSPRPPPKPVYFLLIMTRLGPLSRNVWSDQQRAMPGSDRLSYSSISEMTKSYQTITVTRSWKTTRKNTDKPCLKLRILCSSIPPRTFAARQHINTKTNRDIFRARPSPDMKWDVASSWSCTAFIWEWILLSVNCDFNLYLNAFLSCKSLVLWQ